MKIDIDKIEGSPYTLEEILALISVEYSKSGKVVPYSVNLNTFHTLKTKGALIVPENGGYEVSVTGYNELREVIGDKKRVLVNKNSRFEEFWKEFPSNDSWGVWSKTRTLRSDKPRCKKLYERALINNNVTHEDLITAIREDIASRKSNSSKSNSLSFMKSSSAWLQQEHYAIILEDMKVNGATSEEKDWTDKLV